MAWRREAQTLMRRAVFILQGRTGYMNKKALATAMVVMGLFPSLLFAQLYRMEVDAQESGSQKVIDRVFTGNTVGLQVSFYDGGVPLSMTNWSTRFLYGYGQYDTNGMVPVVGTAGASNNIVVFDSATNVFFSENGSYYFSIVGTNAAGKVRTFARGRLIEEYDPATGGSYSNGIPMPWGNLNFASKEWIVEYILTNEFETSVAYGTTDVTAARGDWFASVSNMSASNAASIVRVGAAASNALAEAIAAETAARAAAIAPLASTQDLADAVAPLASTGYVAGAVSRYLLPTGATWTITEDLVELSGNGGDFIIRVEDGDFYGDWNFIHSLRLRGARLLQESSLRTWTIPAYTSSLPAGTTWTNDGDYATTPPIIHGATRILIRTTNDFAKSSGWLSFSHAGNELGTLLPTCDGTVQQFDFPYISGPTNVGIRATYIAAPWMPDSAPPIVVTMTIETLSDPTIAGRRLDTANAIYEGDNPTYPRQWAPKQYVDAAAASSLAAANAETWSRTGPTDLNGQPLRISPRYDVVSSNETLCIKYGGQTVMRFDGEGAMVVPEIRSFAVEAGAVATLTVWSYAGGATNLLPEVSTNLVAWTRLGSESIISAEMIDAFTAAVVFTNASANALFVRLVDVTGGTGQPVTHLFGQVGINDDVRSAWPSSGSADFGTSSAQAYRGDWGHSLSGRVVALESGSGGISASTATGIAQTVSTSYGFAPTSSVEAIAGTVASNVVAPLLDGSHPVVDYPVTAADTTVALDATNKAYRVHCSGAGTITNWSFAGVSTAALDVVVVQLEPGAATNFSWGTVLATNVALPAANSTNVYFIWRGAGGTGWTVD